MTSRFADGSAGDADYGRIGQEYSRYRQPEPRIASLLHGFLGDASTILNVGAGTGSYEPIDKLVTWDAAYGQLRRRPEFTGSLKLIISTNRTL
jgi:hypothetical protein